MNSVTLCWSVGVAHIKPTYNETQCYIVLKCDPIPTCCKFQGRLCPQMYFENVNKRDTIMNEIMQDQPYDIEQ